MTRQRFFRVLGTLFLLIPIFGGLAGLPLQAMAQDAGAADLLRQSTVTVAVPVLANSIAYGDLVDFDPNRNVYELSQLTDDPYVFGVATKDPPIVYIERDTDVPVTRGGVALVNVTLENGPIKAGDEIIASSLPGKGARALQGSANLVGVAIEDFNTTASTTTTIVEGGKAIQAGTIPVRLSEHLYGGTTDVQATSLSFANGVPAGQICNAHLGCVPAGDFMRYLTAALVAFASVFFAFRTFMRGAANGIISMGRNPRARGMIQSMVIFNAILAVTLAVAGLGAAIVILFIQL